MYNYLKLLLWIFELEKTNEKVKEKVVLRRTRDSRIHFCNLAAIATTTAKAQRSILLAFAACRRRHWQIISRTRCCHYASEPGCSRYAAQDNRVRSIICLATSGSLWVVALAWRLYRDKGGFPDNRGKGHGSRTILSCCKIAGPRMVELLPRTKDESHRET